MRLLVACSTCKRQYDVGRREPGGRFRCRCGAVVTIPEPKGRDAAVVRCSSCGAPREASALQCKFCAADFTLHERDLHTICPACLTRVSDHAKFCHQCGGELIGEPLSGAASDDGGSALECPACGVGRTLAHRRIGEASVLECGRCAGLWLETKPFEELCERAKSEAADLELLAGPPQPLAPEAAPTDMPRQGAWQYRRCPVCREMMHRRNYARRSGVIVDMCRRHGLWFDADELHRILAWIRSAGFAQAQRQETEQAANEARWKERPKTGSGAWDSDETPHFGTTWQTFAAADLLGQLIALFTWRH